MPRWGNRLAKIVIIIVVLGTVGGTGWLAGHGAANPETPPDLTPSADLAPQVITVGEADIVSRLTVDANVQADPPAEVRPQRTGIVTAVYRKVGQLVLKGESLLAMKSSSDPGEISGQGSKGKKPKPVIRVVRASATGRLSSVTAHVGQEVSPSASVAAIDPGRFLAVATIEPKEVYKLYNRPESIKLAIDHGPAPFSCKLMAYGAGISPGSSGGGSAGGHGGSGGPGGPGGPGGDQGGGDSGDPGGGSGGAQVQVSCRIPRSQKVFAGIRGKMSITTDSVRKATVIPLSAVLGEAEKGQVTVVKEDGKREVRKVKLGVNDGKHVQVVDGLEPGEKILDRAPQDPAFTGPAVPGGEGGQDGGPGFTAVPGGGSMTGEGP